MTATKYDALVIAAHPDHAEAQMGGTLAKLANKCLRMVGVEYAEPFKTASLLLVDDPTVFRPGLQGEGTRCWCLIG